VNQDINIDILVCGGGPSGFAAACSAASLGVKVLLVEKYGFLGGAATAGLVNPFMVPKISGESLVNGIFSEIIKRLEAKDACANGELFNQAHIVFDPEILKNIMFDMIEETQAKLLLHSTVVGSIIKGDAVKGVVVNSKSGDTRIFAKMIIDATGDGDVAFLSGADCYKGREQDSLTQPATLMFRIAGINMTEMPSRDDINAQFVAAKKQGNVRTPRENFLWFETLRDGEIHVNSTRVPKIDGTNAFDLTKAEIEARKQIVSIHAFLVSSVKGFEKSYVSYVAPQIGIRESRRVIGEYLLTKDDVISGMKADDPIAKCNYPIDIHDPSGSGTTFKPLGPSVYYEIPYRCLVPKKLDNLLVAGRAISVTHEALSSTRIMPTCMAIGQAAGVAAALSLRKNITPRKLLYSELKKALNDQGAQMRE